MKLSKKKKEKETAHLISELTMFIKWLSDPPYKLGRINTVFNEPNFHLALRGQRHSNKYSLPV